MSEIPTPSPRKPDEITNPHYLPHSERLKNGFNPQAYAENIIPRKMPITDEEAKGAIGAEIIHIELTKNVNRDGTHSGIVSFPNDRGLDALKQVNYIFWRDNNGLVRALPKQAYDKLQISRSESQ